MPDYTLHLGDSLEILKTLSDNSIDAVVTDPPYGFSFMGKKWDYDVPSVELWEECLRVLKPGGHLLSFAGTRTQHRMAVRIEDAGFEIRDMLAWVYGSGFPKSLDVSKAIDRMAGAEREVVGINNNGVGSWHLQSKLEHRANGGTGMGYADGSGKVFTLTAPATLPAQQWSGWGTALKPALEPITLARKPLAEGTVAANVLAWGVGGINVDGCRVETEPRSTHADGNYRGGRGAVDAGAWQSGVREQPASGRWPANLVHDGSDEVVGMFPVTTNGKPSGIRRAAHHFGCGTEQGTPLTGIGDTGSAARFFYCAKASRSEREAGCEGLKRLTPGEITEGRTEGSAGLSNPRAGAGRTSGRYNAHPTVKPIALMRWLCRLVTPPGGLVLDPFMGSGTTGAAAMLEGFNFIGIEREPEYIEIAQRRIAHWKDEASEEDEKQPELFEAMRCAI